MTQLTVYQRMADPLAAAEQLGKAIAKSQMFGAETEAQGIVLSLHCMVTNRDPLSIIESHHLMHGRLTIRSEEMLARVVDDGGEYEIVEHSPEAAEIEISYRGRKFRERFTWEEAKQEPFVYSGKPKEIMPKLLAGQADKLQLSTNYATPRRRMQQLWARVVSDAVRVIAPNLLRGKYTPEETHAIAVEDGRIEPDKPAKPEADRGVIDAEYVVADASTAVPEPGPPKASGEQIHRLTELFTLVGMPPDKQLTAIQKRGARDMGDLSAAGADDLIAALETKSQEIASKAAEAANAASDDPCDEQQVEHCKSLMRQIAQTDGPAITNRLKAHLQSQGLKLADLSRSECQQLIDALSVKNLETFFDMSLKGAAKN